MQKRCATCGTVANENDKYCMVCGTALEKSQQNYEKIQADTISLSWGNYVYMFLIMIIPIVNIVMLCTWAFGREKNQNRKNFAKAALLFVGIGMIVSVGILQNLVPLFMVIFRLIVGF